MRTVELTGNSITVRGLAAQALSRSRCCRPLRRVADRLFGGFVLAFHCLPSRRFSELVDALHPSEPVHLDELVARVKAGKRSDGLFAITIDDGVGETVREIAAVAVERHWPVTFFLPTKYLDERKGIAFQWLDRLLPYLPCGRLRIASTDVDATTADSRRCFEHALRQIMYTRPAREYVPVIDGLRDSVVSHGWATKQQLEPPAPISWSEVADFAKQPELRFESHGVTHTAVSALPPARLEAELLESRRRISEHTNRPCLHFCYPYGGPESIGSDAPQVVQQYFESGVTMSRGRIGGRNPWYLPRIPLYEGDTAAVARLKTLTW